MYVCFWLFQALPGSYKLWYSYLRERRTNLNELPIDHDDYRALNNAFERALVTMSRMPKIWLEYISHLVMQGLITRTRRVCDRALRSLPITQVRGKLWFWREKKETHVHTRLSLSLCLYILYELYKMYRTSLESMNSGLEVLYMGPAA